MHSFSLTFNIIFKLTEWFVFGPLLGFFFCFEVTLVSSTSLRIVLDSIARFFLNFLLLVTVHDFISLNFEGSLQIHWLVDM